MKFKPWILASRPKTLPAASAPVILGTAIALGDGMFQLMPALVALVGALLLQIGSNLANDVFDYKKGTDTSERTGPLRVTQAGLLTPNQVLWGMGLVFVLAFLVGIYLILIGGWPILLIGVLAIICAIAYTGGPFPLGYNGLGEIFVFIFFGPVAVCGTYYVQTLNLNWSIAIASLPVGFLATGILVVNNLRDIYTDRKAGKKTLAVRFGKKATQIEYLLLLAGAFIIPIIIWLKGIASVWIMLPLLGIPLAFPLVKDIYTKEGTPLNNTLAGTARLELVYSFCYSLGYLLDKLLS